MKKLIFGIIAVTFTIAVGCKEDRKTVDKSITEEEMISLLIEDGKEIASATFLALSNELQNAMKSGGVDNALSYCNLNALKITDSLSIQFDADIKRTSLQYRNPKNQPTPTEVRILNELKVKKKSGQVMLPQIHTDGTTKTFFAPIIVQDMCLKCHGQKENIENYKKVLDLYPDDLAIGYNIGDLRGMWSISFKSGNEKSKK